jgi:hypothetical protein
MLPIHLALVSLAPAVSLSEVTKVGAALQKQLVRDFRPIWNIDATIDIFTTLDDVPLDYWPVLVVDTFTRGGQHRLRNNKPYALVAAGRSWSLIASHEVLEMLVDPAGNRLIAGQSPVSTQGRVEFLVEVCDPCQGDTFGYTVNGVLVSDFYTPRYFDPLSASGARYSYSGAITQPRQVLSGGYLSWREPTTADWFQEHRVGSQATIKALGPVQPDANGFRGAIDSLTPETRLLGNIAADGPSFQRALRYREVADRAAVAQASELRTLLETMTGAVSSPRPSTKRPPGRKGRP